MTAATQAQWLAAQKIVDSRRPSTRDPMLAMVVKLDLGKQKDHLAVRIQTYPRIRAWGSPFE